MKANTSAILILLVLTFAQCRAEVKDMAFSDMKEFMRGVFEAWKANQEEVTELLKCIDAMTEIETEIGKVLEELKKLDPTDVNALSKFIATCILAVQKVSGDVYVCFESGSEFINIVGRLFKLSPIELIMKILGNIHMNGQLLWNDIIGIIHALKEGNLYKVGYCLGELMDVMVFKVIKPDY